MFRIRINGVLTNTWFESQYDAYIYKNAKKALIAHENDIIDWIYDYKF